MSAPRFKLTSLFRSGIARGRGERGPLTVSRMMYPASSGLADTAAQLESRQVVHRSTWREIISHCLLKNPRRWLRLDRERGGAAGLPPSSRWRGWSSTPFGSSVSWNVFTALHGGLYLTAVYKLPQLRNALGPSARYFTLLQIERRPPRAIRGTGPLQDFCWKLGVEAAVLAGGKHASLIWHSRRQSLISMPSFFADTSRISSRTWCTVSNQQRRGHRAPAIRPDQKFSFMK